MFSRLKYITALSLTLFSFTSIAEAMEVPSSTPLGEALKHSQQVALFNVNDCFTDADSIQAFIESLLLGSKFGQQITQHFVTDDEVDLEAAQNRIAKKKEDSIEYYQKYVDNIEPSKYAYRAQDTAALLFPLADKLGVNINIIQGEIPALPSYNPYFGNLGVHYEGKDLAYINRIQKNTGSQAVIQEMRKEVEAGKSVYVLNGGSFRLLSDIQETAPDLLPYLDVTVMGFRQPMNFPPFNNPGRKWNPSWNEGIDQDSAQKFMNFASQPTNSQFKAFRIIDSNTVEYAMVCDGKMHPLYKEYIKKLKPFVSVEAYQNVLDAEKRHENWSSFKTKFMDPVIVFHAFGLVSIPHVQGTLVESKEDFCVRPVTQGFPAYYPDSEGRHPFSCPRANTLEDQNPDYATQYGRVAILRTELKSAHKETWDLLEGK